MKYTALYAFLILFTIFSGCQQVQQVIVPWHTMGVIQVFPMGMESSEKDEKRQI